MSKARPRRRPPPCFGARRSAIIPTLYCELGGFMADASASARQMAGDQAVDVTAAQSYRGLRGWIDTVDRLGQLSSIKRIALTLGLPLQHARKVDIVQRYYARMQDLRPLPPRHVNDGPI